MVYDKVSVQSNLDSFLHSTTPVIPSQFLPKSEIKNLNQIWNPWEREKVEYFSLGDMWKFYDELSAYGAGVPVELNTGEILVQYYVPYLSAIQIFTCRSSVTSLREETELGECETRDSSSDFFSDESESDKFWRWDASSSEDGAFEQDSPGHSNDRLGYLYCQYFERSPPHTRVPLMDKINGLVQRYPGLMSLRRVDLSPASWMAVAWYPIYHIPMGRNIKDLSTCFLTYHTLSSSFQDTDLDVVPEQKRKKGEEIYLPAYGLATYKMQGESWFSGNNGRDQERLLSLLSVADSWLKQLGVQHHDFNYFVGTRSS